MKVELLSITPDIEILIERAGRCCYQSYDKIDEGTAERFIKMIIKNGHESVLEHGYASFKISGVSRALSHQLVRHRLAVFSQQSQRYVDQDQFDYVIPDSIINNEEDLLIEYNNCMKRIQSSYDYLISRGIKKEDARFVLPNACCTELMMSCNMREWRHIFKERLSPAAQWEIRKMCSELLKILKEKAPSIFYDFEVTK